MLAVQPTTKEECSLPILNHSPTQFDHVMASIATYNLWWTLTTQTFYPIPEEERWTKDKFFLQQNAPLSLTWNIMTRFPTRLVESFVVGINSYINTLCLNQKVKYNYFGMMWKDTKVQITNTDFEIKLWNEFHKIMMVVETSLKRLPRYLILLIPSSQIQNTHKKHDYSSLFGKECNMCIWMYFCFVILFCLNF